MALQNLEQGPSEYYAGSVSGAPQTVRVNPFTAIGAGALSTPKKKRLPWLDIAKGIAIILVVVGHTVKYESLLRDYIFAFHMPLFFILAGFTFRVKPWGEVIKSSAKRLLLPYVLLFFIWWGIVFLKNPDAFTWNELYQLIGTFVFASGAGIPLFDFEPVGMAWFLVCLFFARLMLNLLCQLFERYKAPYLLQFVIVMLLAWFGVFLGQDIQYYLPFSLDVAFVAVALMWVGYFGKRINFMERWGKNVLCAIIALGVYLVAVSYSDLELAARLYDNALVTFFGAIAGTLFCCQISMLIQRYVKFLNTYLSFMGRNSMLIYCFHAIDWLIPWTSFAALQGVPFERGWASLARVAYVSLLTLLVKRV